MLKNKKVAVIGAGFFGLSAAKFLASNGYEITVFEKNEDAMLSASTLNQARVHAGYHYPRSLSTAARSRKNYSRFANEYSEAVMQKLDSMYAIAVDSKVSPHKFERFMRLIDAKYKREKVSDFLNPELVLSLYSVDETSFDSNLLRDLIKVQLASLSVQILYSNSIKSVSTSHHAEKIHLIGESKQEFLFDGIIVATYGVDDIEGLIEFKSNLQYEVCEIVEVKNPHQFENKSVTIMDGPYWSLTPWPAKGSYVLTNVRHTPHARFSNSEEAISYLSGQQFSRAEIMKMEVSKYAPSLSNLEIEKSHYVIKTILARRDHDDARPIVIKRNKRIMSLVGSKIDNVYDMEEPLMHFVEYL